MGISVRLDLAPVEMDRYALNLLMLRITSLFFVLILSAACGSITMDEPDGSVPDVMVLETRTLELLSDTRLMLSEGANAEISVRYSDRLGRALGGETLDIALEGNANDSSLEDLEITTGGNGEAMVTVIAGAVASTFRVRVSAEDASAVYVNVSVSDSGFGRLTVTPRYAGEREGDLGVAVLTGATCDDDRVYEERTRYRALGEATTAEFVGIPAGVPLAIVGRLDGAELLAAGCVDGVMVEPDATATTTMLLTDFEFRSAGAYETHLRFDLRALQEPAYQALLGARIGVETYAQMLLDVVETIFEEMGATDELTELRAARERGLDETYAASILEQATGFDVALDAMADEVRSALIEVDIVADLRLGETVMMATRDVLVDEQSLGMVATGFNAPVELRGSVEDGGESLLVERLNIHLSAGALSRALARRSAVDAGFESVVSWVSALARCDSLPSPIDSCDAECARTVCERSIEVLVDELNLTYSALDEAWAEVRTSGSVRLEDTTGDLVTDTVLANLEGQWGTEGPAVAVTVDGERLLPPE
ncbi:MAG: hypothetical protein ACI9KE_005584 [Polyangiales bacterium]|jgi:hypothetical protein